MPQSLPPMSQPESKPFVRPRKPVFFVLPLLTAANTPLRLRLPALKNLTQPHVIVDALAMFR